MKSEVIAVILPEQKHAREGGPTQVTAITRDAQGTMEVRQLRLDRKLMGLAMLTGRFNCGKPIVDPVSREVMGYEIEPLAVGST